MTIEDAEEYLFQYSLEEYPAVPLKKRSSFGVIVPPEVLYLPELDLYFSPCFLGEPCKELRSFLPCGESIVAIFPKGDGAHPIIYNRESVVFALTEHLHSGNVSLDNYRKIALTECEIVDCELLGIY